MLHDLAHDFAAALCAVQAGGPAALQGNFLARLAQHLPPADFEAEGSSCRPWWLLPSCSGDFAAEHLLHHIRAAGLRNEATILVFRLPWLQFVLRRRGWRALINDIERNVARSEPREILLDALSLSGPGLLEGDASADEAAESLLPGQIVGRVSAALGARWPATLGALREECWAWRGSREWIRLKGGVGLKAPGGVKTAFKGHTKKVVCCIALPNGRIVSGSNDCTLRVWNVASCICLRVINGHTDAVTCLALLPDGRIVSGSNDKALRVWNAASGKCECVLEGHASSVLCICVLADGRCVSGADDSELRVWNVASGACDRILKGHKWGVCCLSALSDGRIVSGSYDTMLRVWDVASSICLRELSGHTENINCVSSLPDGGIVSGSDDGTLRLWNATSGACRRILKSHVTAVICVSVLPDGRIVSGAECATEDDKTLIVWDLSIGAASEHELAGHRSETVSCISYLRDGRIVTGSGDNKNANAKLGTLSVWDMTAASAFVLAKRDHLCERQLKGHTKKVSCLTALPDDRVVSGSDDGTLRVWDTGNVARSLSGGGGYDSRTKFVSVPPSRFVSWSMESAALQVWDATSGTYEHLLTGHEDKVTCVAPLPGGLIVSGSSDETLRVWDVASGKCVRVLGKSSAPSSLVRFLINLMHLENYLVPFADIAGINLAPIQCVVALPGARVLSGSGGQENALRVWNVASGACERLLKGHTGTVTSLSALPDGRIVSKSERHTLDVWDPVSGSYERVQNRDPTFAALDLSTSDGSAYIMYGRQQLSTSAARIHLGVDVCTSNILAVPGGAVLVANTEWGVFFGDVIAARPM